MAMKVTSASSSELSTRARAARLDAANLVTHGVLAARWGVTAFLPISSTCPGEARRLVASLARNVGAEPSAVSAAETVVSELVSNAVIHAYDEPAGGVNVHAALVGHGIVIIVTDEGRGPRVPSPHPGLGLGWKIVAQLADSFTILESATGGTHVCARMGLLGPPEAS